jgi:pilus assembly protein CpaF
MAQTTIHSNNSPDGLSRLEVMMGMAGASMSYAFDPAANQVDNRSVVHAARFSGSRRVTHITECVGMESDTIDAGHFSLRKKRCTE